jgi:hypothetical protein
LAIISLVTKESIAQQSNASADVCNSISRFYSISDLQKEIDSLNQICDKYLNGIENNTEICDNSMGTVMQKYKECHVLNISTDRYYDSQDTSIYIKFRFTGCEELKNISISYKKDNLRIDSTFNFNHQNWEVTETDNSSGNYKVKFSGGGKVENIYDKQKRLIYRIHINDRLDALADERYFWQNGRLAKTIIKGVERVFTYGTPCDSIIVEPTDLHQMGQVDFNPPPVYNKSFGLLPEETDHEYENFKRNPYKHYAPSSVLEKQKARCEEYKESQKKKEGKK